MLQAELSATASTNPVDEERLDTITDVCSAINTTISILDDLLTFEKMESGKYSIYLMSKPSLANPDPFLNPVTFSVGLMVLHKSDVNVESFIDSCLSIFHTPARGKGITIKMELSDRSVDSSLPVESTDLFFIDKFKMSQVLRNFMSNALKFTPNGGTITVRACFIPDKNSTRNEMNVGKRLSTTRRPLQVESSSTRTKDGLVYVDLETGSDIDDIDDDCNSLPVSRTQAQQGGMLRISVLDSGAGISPENQKRLFNEIIQFNPEVLQAGGGSGFGLYICKGIVDLHGGSINVFSEGTYLNISPDSSIVSLLPLFLDCLPCLSSFLIVYLISTCITFLVSFLLLVGEGMGTMFSFLLPMKRLATDLLHTVASTSACRRYSDPAMAQRLMHDMLRASPLSSPKITPLSSPKLTPRSSPKASPRNSISIKDPTMSPSLLPPSLEPPSMPSPSTEASNGHGSQRTSVVDTIHNVPPPKVPPTAESRVSKGGDGESTKYHILVVDDSPLNRKMLSKLLKSKGHR